VSIGCSLFGGGAGIADGAWEEKYVVGVTVFIHGARLNTW